MLLNHNEMDRITPRWNKNVLCALSVSGGQKDQLCKLWGNSCLYISQISSVPSRSLIWTTQVLSQKRKTATLTLDHYHLMAVYQCVKWFKNRIHCNNSNVYFGLCLRDDLSKPLGQCRRESPESRSAMEGATLSACQQHSERHVGLPAVDKGAVHHWTQTRGQTCTTTCSVLFACLFLFHLDSLNQTLRMYFSLLIPLVSFIPDFRQQHPGDYVQKPLEPGNHFPNYWHRSLRSESSLMGG